MFVITLSDEGFDALYGTSGTKKSEKPDTTPTNNGTFKKEVSTHCNGCLKPPITEYQFTEESKELASDFDEEDLFADNSPRFSHQDYIWRLKHRGKCPWARDDKPSKKVRRRKETRRRMTKMTEKLRNTFGCSRTHQPPTEIAEDSNDCQELNTLLAERSELNWEIHEAECKCHMLEDLMTKLLLQVVIARMNLNGLRDQLTDLNLEIAELKK